MEIAKTYNFDSKELMLNWLSIYRKMCSLYKYSMPYHQILWGINVVNIYKNI